ncbi:hypothetical protein D3C78_741260 [compost metagenome]
MEIFEWFKRLIAGPQVKHTSVEDMRATWLDSCIILPEGVQYISTGVSEPVISFVQCVQKNPRRFHLSREFHPWGSTRLTLLDRESGKTFGAWIEEIFREGDAYHFDDHWLTDAEQDYIVKCLIKVFEGKQERLKQLRGLRRRNQLKKLYCKEEQC